MLVKIYSKLLPCLLICGTISSSLYSQSTGLKTENLSLGNIFLFSAFGKPAKSQDFQHIRWMFTEPVSGALSGLITGTTVGLITAVITKDSDKRTGGLTPAQLAGLSTYPLGCATGIFIAGKILEGEVGSFPWTLLGSAIGIAVDILTGLNYPAFSTIGGMVAYRLTLRQKR